MTNSSNGEGIYKELLERLTSNTFTPIEWEGFTPYNELPPRPPLAQHTKVKIDPALLQKYAGRYGNPPDLIVTFTSTGDHLTIQENDEPKQELFPESNTNFFSTIADDVFTFESDNQGNVTGVVLHSGGQDIRIHRIP